MRPRSSSEKKLKVVAILAEQEAEMPPPAPPRVQLDSPFSPLVVSRKPEEEDGSSKRHLTFSES